MVNAKPVAKNFELLVNTLYIKKRHKTSKSLSVWMQI